MKPTFGNFPNQWKNFWDRTGGIWSKQELRYNLEEVHGCSLWGAGTFAGTDGSRRVTDLEKGFAKQQGHDFYKVVAKAL
ncbi:hypothetical protein KGF57_003926 [Candida theae]|uniref:Uncharacterized protein n=1 Tax=Candida theae TaxID=1198502 RepID=A0AAD5BCL1_9ASCO|nr:uncharacterized protein KGF57_003926 [Candida theae]KAI5954169.1 hypothetical protein KGF57_003926 [Candida theae]